MYDWLQIARKPNQGLKADLKMVFELIRIPTSASEIEMLEKIINPDGKKDHLTKEDFIGCFSIEEECKKPREK